VSCDAVASSGPQLVDACRRSPVSIVLVVAEKKTVFNPCLQFLDRTSVFLSLCDETRPGNGPSDDHENSSAPTKLMQTQMTVDVLQALKNKQEKSVALKTHFKTVLLTPR
jgi:hypothetical protein